MYVIHCESSIFFCNVLIFFFFFFFLFQQVQHVRKVASRQTWVLSSVPNVLEVFFNLTLDASIANNVKEAKRQRLKVQRHAVGVI